MTVSDPKRGMLNLAVRLVEGQLASGEGFGAVLSYNFQAVRGLAYLYLLDGSPLHGDKRLAQGIRDLVKAIAAADGPPDNRLTGHLADAKRLLEAAGAADLSKDMDRLILTGAEVLAKDLHNLRYVTRFSSGNCGTSTNHVAVYGASLYRAGEVLKRDDFRALARATWDRLVLDQHPDGFFAETTPGPASSYNHLTVGCAGRMWKYTGHETFHQAALRGARFHERFCYPDGCDLETVDGRVRYRKVSAFWMGFILSETPAGRGFLAHKLKTFSKLTPPGPFSTHGGEIAALLCESHEYGVDGPAGPALVDRPSYAEAFSTLPAGVRREGPWFSSFQGIAHLPRGWGGFTIDRTSVFSLWHERAGLIVNGSGEPDPNPSQSFRFRPKWDPKAPPVPELARVDMGRPGTPDPAALHAEYRGGTVRMELHYANEREARLSVRVGARADYYPVDFTLALELHDGDQANGAVLGQSTLDLDAAALKGRLDARKFQLEFPAAGARFHWPHDPYNPYDQKEHKSPRDKYVALLTLPLGPEQAEVVFRVPE